MDIYLFDALCNGIWADTFCLKGNGGLCVRVWQWEWGRGRCPVPWLFAAPVLLPAGERGKVWVAKEPMEKQGLGQPC